MSTPEATRLQSFARKPRVFILSDISNEPDDAESLVRYLLYSNQFRTEGLVAITSTWMRNKVCPQDMHKIIDAYAKVVENLNKHAHPEYPYPSADYLRSIIKAGPPVYGFEGVGEDKALSDGTQLLLDSITAESGDPLWILCWGGTNVLAQALLKLKSMRTAEEVAARLSKLRVYTISDQDDTAAWIRNAFPQLFYIASVHAWNQYGMAAWTGISGDRFYGFDQGGPDFSKLTKAWFKENIQIGPLGSEYPDYMFIPEGDTPTFLYLIQNGLGVPEKPGFGSWGGRYQLVDPSQSGLSSGHFADCADIVTGKDGRTYKSNHATIWRWRDAYQDDFAARMQWTLSSDLASANHHPVVSLNGEVGTSPLLLTAEAGTKITLDASSTYDPDGDELTFKWWHYREPSTSQWMVFLDVAEISFVPKNEDGSIVEVTLPGPEKCCVDLVSREPFVKGPELHVILEVADNGSPSLTSYRRIIIQTTNKELKGGDAAGSVDISQLLSEMGN